MSSPVRPNLPPDDDAEPEPKSPNLFVLYGILALGLLLAMGFAAAIVYPFYLRR